MTDLSITDKIVGRPVYLRFLKRMGWEDLEPPTQEEIRDAILILGDPWEDYLSAEALRILDEVG